MFVSIRWRALGLAVTALALAACSPTLNWREMRLEGAPLLALMPCKPEAAVRSVPLLGQATELHMHSCEAGGMTFAVAWAELADGARAGEAIGQWQLASLAAIRVAPGASSAWAVKLAGANTVQGVKAQGSDHRGQTLLTQAVYFAQGNKVYQAAIYGPKLGTEATEATSAFFDGLSLP